VHKPDLKDKDFKRADTKQKELDEFFANRIKKPFFKRILGKIPAKKTLAVGLTVISAVTGLDLTGIIDTGVHMDIDIIEILFYIIPALVTFITGFAIKSEKLRKKINSRVDIAADEISKAMDENSDQGKKISRKELKGIILSVLRG